MGITTESGDIILLNQDGKPTRVASIQHGISFSKTVKHRKVVRVSIHSLEGALSDEYYFTPGEQDWEVVFQHLMTRDIRPELFRLILSYFSEEKHYSPVSFIDHLIQCYFMDELHYEFPSKK